MDLNNDIQILKAKVEKLRVELAVSRSDNYRLSEENKILRCRIEQLEQTTVSKSSFEMAMASIMNTVEMLKLSCESKYQSQDVDQLEDQMTDDECEYLSGLFDQIDQTNNIKNNYEESPINGYMNTVSSSELLTYNDSSSTRSKRAGKKKADQEELFLRRPQLSDNVIIAPLV